ncbi:hypothetical protein EMPG_13253 [Blastomyces silverae]|uniref:Uncharacterized protein n=1 Tax=Blastomyces silverae TaxID=2060906 RepID=A0A0H1BJ61_9EURO|nr:hypothetical protein EMPG_13253 [Blastomyces silverae]
MSPETAICPPSRQLVEIWMRGWQRMKGAERWRGRQGVSGSKSNQGANDRDRLAGADGHIELPALDMFAFSGPSFQFYFWLQMIQH